MRLIDADALCMHLSDWQFGSMTDGKHNAEYEVINKVIDGIEKEPTVKPIKVGDVCKECWRDGGDVVEVVRCKDCKHVGTDATCCLVCTREGMGLKPYHVYRNDFCSYGERRSE